MSGVVSSSGAMTMLRGGVAAPERALAAWAAMVLPCVAADAVPAALAVSPAPRHKNAAAIEILRIPLFLGYIPAP